MVHGAKELRSLLESDEMLVVPGAYDATSAIVIESLGFDAVYATGYGTEASRLGLPDIGMATLPEMTDHGGNLSRAVDVPVISDADTGYGGPLNVVRTVEDFEQAGVAGIHIEDQAIPKKCGGLPGRKLVSVEDMVGKIQAATEAADDLVVIARTDARSIHDVDEAMRRLDAYLDAGADGLLIGEPYEISELEDVTRSFPNKLMTVAGNPGWEETQLPLERYEEWGMKALIFPLNGLYAAAKAVERTYRRLRDEGNFSQQYLEENGYTFEEFNDLMGLDEWVALEKRYSG
jgi:2-methylisocitrate lyase-like PEP mutase family enzyme